MGRGEDKIEPIGNLSQIISGLFGDVSRVVVEHHTNLGRWGILLVHPLEEGNKLSTTMTVHHLAMYSAGEQVNTRHQADGAVADVFVTPGPLPLLARHWGQ